MKMHNQPEIWMPERIDEIQVAHFNKAKVIIYQFMKVWGAQLDQPTRVVVAVFVSGPGTVPVCLRTAFS